MDFPACSDLDYRYFSKIWRAYLLRQSSVVLLVCCSDRWLFCVKWRYVTHHGFSHDFACVGGHGNGFSLGGGLDGDNRSVLGIYTSVVY